VDTAAPQTSVKPLEARAREALRRQDWTAALATAEELLDLDPTHAAGQLLAGEAASRLERYAEALGHYGRVAQGTGPEALTALLAAAELQRVVGSIDQAETLYRLVLERQPDHERALAQLALILKLTGRGDVARPLLWDLLGRGAIDQQGLLWLADPPRLAKSADYLRKSLAAVPGQFAPALGLAAEALAAGAIDRAAAALVELRQRYPRRPVVELLYAETLWQQADWDELARWVEDAPAAVREHAAYWDLAGRWQERQGAEPAALRCYLETLARDADHSGATHRAAALFHRRGTARWAVLLDERHARLRQVALLADEIHAQGATPERAYQLARTLESLDRPWEALAWLGAAMQQTPQPTPEQFALVDRLKSRVEQETPAIRRPLWPEFSAELARWPLPRDQTGDVTTPAIVNPLSQAAPRWRDEAAARGVDFRFFDAADETTPGRRMHEAMGGGVGVLDYELDGRPDLYFTQGAPWPAATTSGAPLDRLFRQSPDGIFADVTDLARIREPHFSQGVAAGDFNNDGFTDLYVANLGINRLFVNLGEGTFREVALPLPVSSSVWTSSVAIADLDRDGHPDLYDVTYLTGPDVFERRCPTPAGPRVCHPSAFAAATDRWLAGQGDGTFRDDTELNGLKTAPGRGLGLLVGGLRHVAATEVFIANDSEANTLWTPLGADAAKRPLREIATPIGLAYSAEGLPQACMGIAAADFDANGRLDLFVTNYANEPNALYRQLPEGLFDDRSAAAGLVPISRPMLGFGTQALDVELDGDFDLVVVNGDLDDFMHEGRPFRMRPQCLLNDGAARFEDWRNATSDDYFAPTAAYRGRGLARSDLNRDGREDFVVSQLDDPAAVVINQTATEHHGITLRLVGTVAARDAIGGHVVVETSEAPPRTIHTWITAGDGYQASNDRALVIGLGTTTEPVTATVFWPDGTEQRFEGLLPDRRWILRQGAARGVAIKHHE
jgi:tetratricopeptide (TPR) repeat protein